MQNNFLEEQYHPSHVILPAQGNTGALLLGDFNSATDIPTLSQFNIKTIITAAEGLSHLSIDPKYTHITYPLLDCKSQNIAAFFEQSHQTIAQSLARGGVLVHCAAGVSRSATLIIAYLMKQNRWGFRKAIDFVRKRRPCVCPNLGFEMQLKAYQRELGAGMPSKAVAVYRSRNIIPAEFESVFAKQANPQRGASFPTIPNQTRSLLRRKVPTRNGTLTRQKQPQKPQSHSGSHHAAILRQHLIISSLTGYHNSFQKRKHKRMASPQSDNLQISRNLAKMMFGSYMHKWTTNKILEEQVHSIARKRVVHIKK